MRKIVLSIFMSVFGVITLFAQDYEWNVSNVGSVPGERIIAVINAGTIDSYDGINIFGEIYDANGNWGYNIPTKSEFSCYIKFSGFNYSIIQSVKITNIVLRLRKISDSIVHLIGYMPYSHTSAIVTFKVVKQSSISSITLGNPNVVDSSGTLILGEPTYKRFFTDNLGIGTTTPDSKLTVAGNIHAREVKVTVNAGADFVFHDDYNLPKLEEVEQFIKANKHLPEIASEIDMQANGIHLAEMNIKLLQKIEELTLYTIEQQKQISNLFNKVEELQDKLNHK